ncbi:MAG: ABC transporter substrate-binding protein [Massiliimalia sp.]|jgi:multiple sugar transport system substrate-binding protein
MQKRKLFSAILASLMAGTIAMTGCSSENTTSSAGTNTGSASSGEKTQVDYVFWGNQTEINTIMNTIDMFNKSQDKVEVKGTGMDSSVYFQKLNAYISSKTMPDIVQVAADYGDIYNAKGVFMPLDDLIDGKGFRDQVSDSLWSSLSYENQVYAVPIVASAPILIGNKQLFEEAGIEFPTDSWTEEEFKDAAIKMTNADKGQYGVIFAGAIKEWPRAIYGNGEYEVYNYADGTMNATNPGYEHILDLLVNQIMLENKAAPAILNAKDIGGGFETGKYGMVMAGFWDIAEFHKVIQDSFEWDLLPMPTSEEYGQWRTPIYANALSLSKDTKKSDAAFEYLNWIATDEEAQMNSVFLPINNTVTSKEDFLTSFPEGSKQYNKQLALDALNNGVSWQNTGVIAEINDNVINPSLEKLILKPDETTLEDTLNTIQEEGQKVFDTSK